MKEKPHCAIRISSWAHEYGYNICTPKSYISKPKQIRLHCCFIDYKKAFDTINREELVKYVKMGSTEKFLRVILLLYIGIRP